MENEASPSNVRNDVERGATRLGEPTRLLGSYELAQPRFKMFQYSMDIVQVFLLVAL